MASGIATNANILIGPQQSLCSPAFGTLNSSVEGVDIPIAGSARVVVVAVAVVMVDLEAEMEVEVTGGRARNGPRRARLLGEVCGSSAGEVRRKD